MIWQDFRYAVRQLRKTPGFTAAAVLTLALGLGASSAIFCLMDGLWLHPMRVPHPGQLVRIFSTTAQDSEGAFTYSEVNAMRAGTPALSSVMAIGRRGSMMVRPDGTAALELVNVVSANFFDELGVRPAAGRAFTAADAGILRTHPGVLLGYGFWQREFAGDPAAVGKQIWLMRGGQNRTAVDIWGVLPPDFREIDNGADRDLWMPAETWAAIARPQDLTSSEFRWFNALVRLRPGASVSQANLQATAVAKALELGDAKDNHGRGARVVSDFNYRMSRAGTSGLLLFAIAGCVVLLAAANVALLLLARGLSRTAEVALRVSLGATRWAVARQLLLENLLLGALGLAAGLAMAAAVAAALPQLLVSGPATLGSIGSSTAAYAVGGRVFAFAALLMLVTMALLALVPLMQGARPRLQTVLQSASATRTAGKMPLARRAAVWAQIAVSFALLVSTGALVRSFINTRTQSIGLTRDQTLLAWTQEPDAPMRDAVVEQMRALPGVERVEYAVRAPLSLSEGGMAAKTLLPSHPELREPVEIKYNAVSPGFLDAIGTRIVRGRGFTEADNANGPPVVVIDRTMAQKYWPTQDPLGQIVRLPGFLDGPHPDLEARVIGAAEDAPINTIGEMPEPYLYVPFRFSSMGEITFALRTGPEAMSLAQPVRQVLIHANPLLDPMMVTSLPELIRYSSGNYRMMAELVSALGAIGLALTVVGLYGFLAFRVAERRREIGIRMALGASRERTVLMVLRDTARLAAVGLALGVALALGAARLEASVLFGVRPLDALSISAALCVSIAAMTLAAWLPARRAARIEPMQALRME